MITKEEAKKQDLKLSKESINKLIALITDNKIKGITIEIPNGKVNIEWENKKEEKKNIKSSSIPAPRINRHGILPY